MPIDLKSELARREAAVSSKIAGMGQTSALNVEAARRGIIARREAFLVGSAGAAVSSYGGSRFGGAPQAAGEISRGNLIGEAERSFAARLRDEDVKRLDLVYRNAVRRAEQAGLDVQSAEGYARQVLQQDLKQQFAAEQAQLDRESALRTGTIQDEQARITGDIAEQYQPQNDYEGAMYRALFGLGGAVGTAYGIKKYNQYRNQPVPQNQPTPGFFGRTQVTNASRIPYNPSRRTDSIYGEPNVP